MGIYVTLGLLPHLFLTTTSSPACTLVDVVFSTLVAASYALLIVHNGVRQRPRASVRPGGLV